MHAELKIMKQQKLRQPPQAAGGGAWQLGDAAADAVTSRLQAAHDSPVADLQQLLCEAGVALHLLAAAAGTPAGLEATWPKHGALHGKHSIITGSQAKGQIMQNGKCLLDACC